MFYLVAGAVTGAHLPAVRAWMWRRRWAVLAAAVLVTASVETWYGFAVRSGQAPGSAADPFAPEAIPLYVATFAVLWLAGGWWAARSRDGWPSRLVRATSDNSLGVYLSHVMFLDVLFTLGLGRLDRDVPWILTVLIAVAVSWLAATAVTVIAARTPVSRWLVGRARRPWRGGPPPAGRGTCWENAGKPDRAVQSSCGFSPQPPQTA